MSCSVTLIERKGGQLLPTAEEYMASAGAQGRISLDSGRGAFVLLPLATASL